MDLLPTVLTQSFGGEWHALEQNDDVFVDGVRLAKVASERHGARLLRKDLITSIELAWHGVPVLIPLTESLVVTPAGPVALWPYVAHVGLDARKLGTSHAVALGDALSVLSKCVLADTSPWDPFEDVPARLAGSRFSPGLVHGVRDLVETVEPIAEHIMKSLFTFAHGDPSVDRTLFLDDGSVRLVELDATGWRPAGWDLACLFVQLVLEGDNAPAFVALREGYTGADESSETRLDELSLVKATMTTAAGLTREPTVERSSRLSARLIQMFAWARGARPTSLVSAL